MEWRCTSHRSRRQTRWWSQSCLRCFHPPSSRCRLPCPYRSTACRTLSRLDAQTREGEQETVLGIAFPDYCSLLTAVRLVVAVPRLVYQAQWHDERQVAGWIVPSYGLDRGRALGRLEGDPHLVGGHVLEDLEQIRRVEADFERLAFVGDRELVLRLAQVGGLHRELHRAPGEREADAVGLVARDHAH